MIPLFPSPSICIHVTAYHNHIDKRTVQFKIRVCIEIIFLMALSECKRLMSLLCSQLPKLHKKLAIPSVTDSNKSENIIEKARVMCAYQSVRIKHGE